MKTVESIFADKKEVSFRGHEIVKEFSAKEIQEIQLDAIKATMEYAAKSIPSDLFFTISVSSLRKSILTAAQNPEQIMKEIH